MSNYSSTYFKVCKHQHVYDDCAGYGIHCVICGKMGART